MSSLPHLQLLAVPLSTAPATERPNHRERPKPSRDAALQLRALAAAAGTRFAVDTSGSDWLPAQFSVREPFYS